MIEFVQFNWSTAKKKTKLKITCNQNGSWESLGKRDISENVCKIVANYSWFYCRAIKSLCVSNVSQLYKQKSTSWILQCSKSHKCQNERQRQKRKKIDIPQFKLSLNEYENFVVEKMHWNSFRGIENLQRTKIAAVCAWFLATSLEIFYDLTNDKRQSKAHEKTEHTHKIVLKQFYAEHAEFSRNWILSMSFILLRRRRCQCCCNSSILSLHKTEIHAT